MSSTSRSRDPSPSVDKRTSLSNIRSRDPSPANNRKQPLSIARSRDPSPLDSKFANLSITKLKNRDPSPAPSESKIAQIEARIRSRDPSPVTISSASSRLRSRDPSPADTSFTARRPSRDPSPAESRFTPSYKMYSRNNTSTPSNTSSTHSAPKYTGSSSASIGQRSPAVEKALSYLSSSEARSRSASLSKPVSQSSASNYKKVPEPAIIKPKPVELKKDVKLSAVAAAVLAADQGLDDDDDDEEVEYEEIEIEVTDDSEEEEEEESEDEGTVAVNVVTRSTSPTQPTTTSNYLRSRRNDNAKTIEKTIQRKVKKPKCEDKAVQSDRMDDTTRYSRFANSSARLSMSNYLDSKYSRYSSSSSPRTYSTDSSRSYSTSTKESNLSSSKSRSPPKASLVTRPSIASSSTTSSSSETNRKVLPPKAESPTKSISTTSSPVVSQAKWPNKDFRKSSLNMSIFDRSNATTDTDTSQYTQPKSTPLTRSERSKSFVSNSSSDSSTSSNDEDDSKLNKTKASSRTSLLASSADELPLDKLRDDDDSVSTSQHQQILPPPTTPVATVSINASPSLSSPSPSSSSSQQRNDEAKSFLMRALGPVTHIFRTRTPIETTPDKNWLDSNSTSVSESLKLDTEPVRTEPLSSNSQNNSNNKDSLDMKYKLRHIDSGERAWWCNSSEDVSASIKKDENNIDVVSKSISNTSMNNNSANKLHQPEVIRINLHRIESGEKAWWLSSSGGNSASNKATPSPPAKKTPPTSSSSGKSAKFSWWTSVPENDIEPELDFKSPQTTLSFPSPPPPPPPPLGDRASPEGLEDTSQGDLQAPFLVSDRPKDLFISRHTNIDDLLGGSCHAPPFSPGERRVSANDIFEEITVDQVKIHEGTPGMPAMSRTAEIR